jgi:hypothetical protein
MSNEFDYILKSTPPLDLQGAFLAGFVMAITLAIATVAVLGGCYVYRRCRR